MKIDKKMIDKVLTLNDEQLWKAIQIAASKSGLSSVKSLEKPKDMTKIRSTLSGLNEGDIARVTELLKKEKENG